MSQQYNSLDNNVFKKNVLSWYDSDTGCFVISGIMTLIFLFALTGIWVAVTTPLYYFYRFIPITLAILSAIMIASSFAKIINRLVQSSKQQNRLYSRGL